MLKTKNGYKLISDKDLFISIEYAVNHHLEDTLATLNQLFIDIEGSIIIKNEVYHKIDNKLLPFFLGDVKLKDDEIYIDINTLKEGYIISKYEKNSIMNKKIYSYLIKFINNEINGLTNDILIHEIINDRPLLNYLKKYENLEEFITTRINKKISKMDNYYLTKEKKKVA